MADCIFCRIVKKEIPSRIIYEDKKFMAFLDINPANKGHTLVITKGHYELFSDIPTELLGDFFTISQKITKAVVKATSAEGYNLFINNKKAAGQIVPHVHFHILPRFNEDGIKFNWPNRKYEENEAEIYLKKIKDAIK